MLLRDPDLADVAIEVYDLEISRGSSHEAALKSAVSSVSAHLDQVFGKIAADYLIGLAEELDADDHEPDSIFYDGVAALLSAAMDIGENVPVDYLT